MNVELFIWCDPHSVVDDWTEISQLCMDAKLIVTVGIVVKESEGTIAISNGVGSKGDSTTMGTLVLPRSAIVRREVIGSVNLAEPFEFAPHVGTQHLAQNL